MRNPAHGRRSSIRTRIILMVVGTLVLATAAKGYLIHNLVRDYILGQKLATVDVLTASMLHDITYTGTSDLTETGRTVVAKYMTYYRIIKQVSVYRADGVSVANSDGKLVGSSTTDPEVLEALTRAKPSLHVSRPDLSNFGIRSISPIMRGSSIVGAVCLDVSLQDIDATVAASDRHIMLIMAASLTVVVVALFILFRVSIVARLRRLMEMTRQLTLGNYDTHVEDLHGDEIGELARAFNHMATDLRSSQAKIAEHNRDLTQRVTQATAELQQAYEDLKSAQGQLVLNEKMASLGVLIAGVAHEINTPVGAILNVSRTLETHLVAMPEHLRALKLDSQLSMDRTIEFLQVLASSASNARPSPGFRQQREVARLLKVGGISAWQQRANVLCRFNFVEPDLLERYMDCIRSDALFGVAESYAGVAQAGMISKTSSQKISEIVRALKCYARSEAGQAEPMHINDSIATALVLLRNHLKHDVDVDTQFDPDLPLVACSGDIHQVWTNLLSNACDAIADNPAGSRAAIKVRTVREGPHVVVSISDNGPGIAPEIMDRIFDPFFTTKDIGKGTGLGLSIVSGIVTRNGGTIHVESQPGRTTFSITLPIRREASAAIVPANAEPGTNKPKLEGAGHESDERAA